MVKNRSPARNGGCCTVNTLKYLLFIYVFFFFLTALALLALGIYTYVTQLRFASLMPSATFVHITYAIILLTLVMLLVGVVGCIAVAKMNKCALLLFTISLLLVFLVQFACGLFIFIYSDQVHSQLDTGMQPLLAKKYSNNDAVTNAMDELQTEFGCCGVHNFTEWRSTAWYSNVGAPSTSNVPTSCCRSRTFECNKSAHPSNIYTVGCIDTLAISLQQYALIYGAVTTSLCIVQLFGLLISCCLYTRLRDDARYQKGRKRRTQSPEL